MPFSARSHYHKSYFSEKKEYVYVQGYMSE